MTPTTVISNPDAHQERMVMTDLSAPTAKCARMLIPKAATTADMPLMKKNGMIGMNAPIAVESAAEQEDFHGLRKCCCGESEFALGHGLHHLLGLFRESLRHALRFFCIESLQLVEERHLFDFFLRIFLDLRFLARDFGFVNLALRS